MLEKVVVRGIPRQIKETQIANIFRTHAPQRI